MVAGLNFERGLHPADPCGPSWWTLTFPGPGSGQDMRKDPGNPRHLPEMVMTNSLLLKMAIFSEFAHEKC